MFVRHKKTPSGKIKVQLVHNTRDPRDNQIKQKVYRHFGTAQNDQHLEDLLFLAEKIKIEETKQISAFYTAEQLARQIARKKVQEIQKKKEKKDRSPQLSNIVEESRITTGIHDVFGPLYDQLQLDKIIPEKENATACRILKDVVLARIANPDSKRANVRDLSTRFGIQIALHKVYRMMDRLTPGKIDKLKRIASQQACSLLARPLRVLFFDCTTLYFESFKEDDLKQSGYSKDAKFKEMQVLLALMVTEDGLPVHYEVLPGASFEGHSLIPIVEQMKKEYDLKDVICVADRGMCSEANLKCLDEAGIGFIVGCPLKRLNRDKQKQILEAKKTLKNTRPFIEFEEKSGRKLVVHYSTQRERREAKQRKKMLLKLKAKIKNHPKAKEFINNQGYKKFIEFNGSMEVLLKDDKIKEAAAWDGLKGFITNRPELTAEEVLNLYGGLWQVEETFRMAKHDLKVRPIFHWTQSRIEAHIAICFMCLMCVRHLEYRVKTQYKKLSPRVIIDGLTQVQASIVKVKNSTRRYAIPSSIPLEAQHIYRIMGKKYSPKPYPLKKIQKM